MSCGIVCICWWMGCQSGQSVQSLFVCSKSYVYSLTTIVLGSIQKSNLLLLAHHASVYLTLSGTKSGLVCFAVLIRILTEGILSLAVVPPCSGVCWATSGPWEMSLKRYRKTGISRRADWNVHHSHSGMLPQWLILVHTSSRQLMRPSQTLAKMLFSRMFSSAPP